MLRWATPGWHQVVTLHSQDYHQHSCPASKVYTDTSPFKYDRQSSSGHKLFRQVSRPTGQDH